MPKSPSDRAARVSIAVVGGLLLAAAGPLSAQQEGGYAYLRIVEGYADHLLVDGETFQAAINYPVVPGDRLALGPGARIEVVLPDGSAVRAAEEAQLRFAAVAGTLDVAAAVTQIELERGELQVVRPSWSGPEPVELRLGAARVLLEAPGSYRVGTDGYGSAAITVREGWAEVSTPSGSQDVRMAETAWVREGASNVELARAAPRDELEWWGAALDRDVQVASQGTEIDSRLAYAAAPLEGRGEWVDVSGRRAWRPWVEVGWRPYTSGHWAWTPSGMAWVASEPWGWLTHHYGLWEQVGGFGWVWVPGRVYSPAWVYWYWGPTHVAWVPAGVYASYYSSWDYHPSWGVYGWVSGGWDHYRDWVFCRVDDFGYGRHHGRFQLGREVAGSFGGHAVPRGVLATDTRPLTRGGWAGQGVLGNRFAEARRRVESERPDDLTSFVARRPEAAAQAARLFTRRPEAVAGGGSVLGDTRGGAGTARPGAGLAQRPGPAADLLRDTVRPASPGSVQGGSSRWTVRPAPPSSGTGALRPGVGSGGGAESDSSRWTVRPAPPSSGTGALRPGVGSGGGAESDGSRWTVRPAPPSSGTGALRPGVGSGGGAQSDGSRWTVRPAPPSSGTGALRPGVGSGGGAQSDGSRWTVRPAPSPYRTPEGEAWRERIQLRPQGTPSAPNGDRGPLVRRVVGEIQQSVRPSAGAGGWSPVRPPSDAGEHRPQAVRPAPERSEPQRSGGERSEVRSRGDEPPSRERGNATSSRGGGRPRGGDESGASR